MDNLELKDKPVLKDYQEYVKRLEVQRGFDNQNTIEKCLLMGEEMGELFKAVRKAVNLKTDVTAKVSSVKEEIADVLIYLCAIANRFDVDMEQAFREKEAINKKRKWA